MGAKTKIAWCDKTFNPWLGCQKVSPACDNCYAEKFVNTLGKGLKVEWGAGKPRQRTSDANWKQPLRWNRQAEIKFNAWEKFKAENPGLTDTQLEAQGFVKPRRPRVFCGSLCDVFDNAAPDEWRVDLLELILKTRYLNWLLLTKRIGNAMEMLDRAISTMSDGMAGWDGEEGFEHVWLGITVCNQEEADRDIPKLLEIPAAKRFLSIEPMLGAVDILKWLDPYTCADCEYHGDRNDCADDRCSECGKEFGEDDICQHCGCDERKDTCPQCGGRYECDYGFMFSSEKKLIDWVIVGGETGKNARPLNPEWVRNLCNQRKDAEPGALFFFKQWGEFMPAEHPDCPCGFPFRDWIWGDGKTFRRGDGNRGGMPLFRRVGKKRAGRLLDGREWLEMPE